MLLEKFTDVTKYAYGKEDNEELSGCINFIKTLEPSLREKNLKFENITMIDINKAVYNCRLGAEMAILSNVIAFYCSNVKDYETASKLYGAAYCFGYNNNELKLATLRNLKKTYRKTGKITNLKMVDQEILKLNRKIENIDDQGDLSRKKAG